MLLRQGAARATGFKYRNDFIRGSISQRTDHALSSARRGTILEDGTETERKKEKMAGGMEGGGWTDTQIEAMFK